MAVTNSIKNPVSPETQQIIEQFCDDQLGDADLLEIVQSLTYLGKAIHRYLEMKESGGGDE